MQANVSNLIFNCPTTYLDIFVEFTPQNYTVSEGDGYANVTVTAYGFPGGQFDTVNVIVLLMTEDGTAEGKHIQLH